MAKSRQCKNPECLKFFTPKRNGQVYCCGECREADYNVIYERVIEVKKICPNCGSNFLTTKPLVQEYCLPECRVEAAKKVVDGRPLEFAEQANERMSQLLLEHPEIQTRFDGISKPTDKSGNGTGENKVEADSLNAPFKKPYPEDDACELCNKVFAYKRRKMAYHIWDDSNPSAGLYLCGACQALAERTDAGYGKRYLELVDLEVKRVEEAAQQQEEAAVGV